MSDRKICGNCVYWEEFGESFEGWCSVKDKLKNIADDCKKFIKKTGGDA